MRWNRPSIVAALGALVLLATVGWQPAVPALGTSGRASPPSIAPPFLPMAPPPHPLLGVASIVQGDVIKVWNDFDQRLGPRTYVTLSNIVVLAGSSLPAPTFSQLGGPLPNGTFVEVSELPRFSVGARYVLFFGKQASLFTPVWARLAFRLEQAGGKDIVLGPDGQSVLQFNIDGVRFGQKSLLVENNDLTNALTPQPLRADIASSDPDVASAMTPAQFVDAAKQSASSIGAPLGDAISLEPPQSAQWDATPTSPN